MKAGGPPPAPGYGNINGMGGGGMNGMNGTFTNGTGAAIPKPVSTVNYGPELQVTVWTMTAFSIVVVFLRLVGNYKFGNIQLSDLVTLFAL
ncbi:hypothetical protein BO71DRAFT_425867, partial [Aspergillus ellipticus CBS 707.79]